MGLLGDEERERQARMRADAGADWEVRAAQKACGEEGAEGVRGRVRVSAAWRHGARFRWWPRAVGRGICAPVAWHVEEWARRGMRHHAGAELAVQTRP